MEGKPYLGLVILTFLINISYFDEIQQKVTNGSCLDRRKAYFRLDNAKKAYTGKSGVALERVISAPNAVTRNFVSYEGIFLAA